MNSGIGFDNVLPFIGIVEDRNDPRKMGRVRVRCFGVHPEDRAMVPTEDLPWATMVSGTYSANIKPPEHSQWVFGMFLDGKDAQHPLILGTLVSMPTVFASPTEGFSDPEGVYPKPEQIYQPDMSRLARGEEIQNTQTFVKEALRTKAIDTANGETWDQPKSPYNASYPDNKVDDTKSGHAIELDDTPGSERLHLFHRTGTFSEIDNTGTRVEKTVGDCYVVVDRNRNVHIAGAESVTIEGNSQVYVKGNALLKVDGNMDTIVHGDYNLSVGGQMNINVAESLKSRSASIIFEAFKDNIDVKALKKIKIENGEQYSHHSVGKIIVKTDNEYNVTSTLNLNLKSSDEVNIQASDNFNADAAQVHLNSGVSSASDSAFLETKITGFTEAPERKQVDPIVFFPLVSTNYGEEIGVISDDIDMAGVIA